MGASRLSARSKVTSIAMFCIALVAATSAMRSCRLGSPLASLNRGTTTDNVGVDDDTRARVPALVGFVAILG